MNWIVQLAHHPEVGARWRFRGHTPAPEVLNRKLWENVLCQFVICTDSSDDGIGLATLYNADMVSGFAWLGVLVDSPHQRGGVGPYAAASILTYAFDTWPLRRMYIEVPEFNSEQMGGLSRHASLASNLTEHEYFAGRYWDLATYRIDRDMWSNSTLRTAVTNGRPAEVTARLPSRDYLLDILGRADVAIRDGHLSEMDSLQVLEVWSLLELDGWDIAMEQVQGARTVDEVAFLISQALP